MKRQSSVMVFSGILAAAISACAQGTFQNLGFESATLVPADSGYVQFSPAFPGWFGYVGGVQQTLALSNSVYLDTSGIGIIDRGYSNPNFGGPSGVIEGNYTAVLMAGVVGSLTNPADTTLSQTSLVPVAAQSLWFKAWLVGASQNFLQVTLGGEKLSLQTIGNGTNYMLFAADIRALAGQTAELDFTAVADRPHGVNNYLFLDSIEFSDQAIPEPNVLGLLAVGAVVLGVKLRRRLR